MSFTLSYNEIYKVSEHLIERRYDDGFYEAVYSRSSIRSYKEDPVPEELVNKILDAACWAPSWRNLQCWHFIVVRDTGILKELQKQELFTRPPVYCCRRRSGTIR